MMRIKPSVIALAAALSAVCLPALAETQSSEMTVYVNVIPACSIDYAGFIWANHEQGANTDTSGVTQAEVRCIAGTSFTLSYNEGENPDSGSSCLSPQRRASSWWSESYVSYELYQDSSHSQVLGCDADNQLYSVGSGESEWFDIYWRVPADQPGIASTGMHQDYVTATLTF